MAAITGATSAQISPNAGKKCIYVETPATADSADTIDVSSSTVTGGETLSSIDAIYAYDQTSGDQVTATHSGTTITLDAAGGTTNHVYALIIWGDA